MYGYFRPRDSKLTTDELRLFNAYYCRICYCLRILGGQPARFFTTFDMAVYSLVLNIAQKKERPRRYACEHFGSRVMHCFDNDEIGKRLASMSILMFGEKIRDDQIDGNHLRSGGMNLLFGKTVAQAQAAEPRMAEIARKGTDAVNRLQAEGQALNLIWETYGSMVADLFCCLGALEEKYTRVIRNIAVWTFYIDMLHDYNKDYRSNAYNGFRVDGLRTLRECFDVRYADFIRVNQQISSELRDALNCINDGSQEWRILNKIIDTALTSTTIPALSTRPERLTMQLEYCKQNVRCFPMRSNFR